MTIKVCEETIMALMEASKGFETRIKQLEVGIEAAEQHIAGKSAAVRVFKRILRDTKNEERIKVISKCLEDAEWDLEQYEQQLNSFTSEVAHTKILKEDFNKIIKTL